MKSGKKIAILGIVNLTDDSFYAASRMLGAGTSALLALVERHLEEGADRIDIGACSTRPGSVPVEMEEEWSRLSPALEAIRSNFPEAPLSVDTFRSEIVRRTYDLAGPFLVNDITAGTADPGMLPLVGSLGLPYIAMHMRGTPETMHTLTGYEDICEEVLDYFTAFAGKAERYGIRDWILDPGFGFSKTIDENYTLLSSLDRLQVLGRPILVGVSRKSMIYKKLGISPEEALPATQAVHMAALERGAEWLRVHDVKEARETVRIYLTV